MSEPQTETQSATRSRGQDKRMRATGVLLGALLVEVYWLKFRVVPDFVDLYAELGPVETIFCRNVLMYLSTQARRRVVEGFYDALVPGGYLLLGHSESLISVPGRFDLVNLSTDLVYRKPG